jgi:NAD(P)H dehydrogenase (quinone)
MNVSVILAHPNPESFNHAIARTALSRLQNNNHTVMFHDLYAEQFDPLLPTEEIPTNVSLPEQIEMHCQEIYSAEGIIIVHPNWWGQPPAILKGWVDRVMRPDVAYKFLEGDTGEGTPVGLLKAHTAIVFNTSNTGAKREREVFGDPVQLTWKNCIFDLCGVRSFYREMFTIVVTSTVEKRQEWLEKVDSIIDEHFPFG